MDDVEVVDVMDKVRFIVATAAIVRAVIVDEWVRSG